MGQFDRCCVRGCRKKRSQTKGLLSFFKIPRAPAERRQDWIAFIRRKREAGKNWKVCSEHFSSGKPNSKADNVDYIPTLNGSSKSIKAHKKGWSGDEANSSTSAVSQLEAGEKTPTKDHEDNGDVRIKKETTDTGSQAEHSEEQPEVSVKVEFSNLEGTSDTDDDSSSSSSSDGELPKRKPKPAKPPPTCEVCGADFKSRMELRRHKKVHSDPNKKKRKDHYECTMCDKVLPSKYQLDNHLYLEHQQAKKFMCDLCGRSFIRHSGLTDHRLTHYRELTFQCSQCGKGFARKSELHCHELRSHGRATAQTPLHVCEVCGMQFLVSSRLRAHMSKHVESIKKCPHCGKEFRHACNLRTHVRGMHEDDKKFQCGYCTRRFGNSYNLKVHERIHTGEKPYTCDVCDKGFADVCNFRRHQEKCGDGTTAGTPHRKPTKNMGDDVTGKLHVDQNFSQAKVNSEMCFDGWQTGVSVPTYHGVVFPQATMLDNVSEQFKAENLPSQTF